MLDSLITSKTRIKLLLKFFANPDTTAYLRSLAEEFDESTNSVRVELNRLADANLLTSRDEGRTKVYQANPKHPLFCEVQSMVRKFMGIDQLTTVIFDKIAALGQLEEAYLVGDYAKGIDAGCIDVVIIGKINPQALNALVEKAEGIVHREIKVQVREKVDSENILENKLLLWDKATMENHSLI